MVDGGVDDKDDKEGETPLLKETECPVCLQVRQYKKTVKGRNSKMKIKLPGNGNDSSWHLNFQEMEGRIWQCRAGHLLCEPCKERPEVYNFSYHSV